MVVSTPTAPAFALSRIGQIAIPTQDLDRATTFYREQLGIRFLFAVPNLAFFDCDGIRLMLSVPEQEGGAHASSVLYFAVPDLGAAYATLTERGVEFLDAPHLIAEMPDHELWMAFFTDSEGNTLGLMSEVSLT